MAKRIQTYSILSNLVLLCVIPFVLSNPEIPNSPPDEREGQWQLLHESIGISAMHMQLLHNNKVVIFDRTDIGPSNLSLSGGRCRYDPNDQALKNDCTAHSVLYDIASNTYKALTVQTDVWCSSGAVLPNGTLIQTGGFNDGDHVIRSISPCDDCDWLEFPRSLERRRWYATNQILPDGRIIIVGGRAQFNYEFYPRNSKHSAIYFRFLRETRDESEDNLYPFVLLLPDGNLFIFANTRGIVFDYKDNRVVRELPSIPGGEPRNYPSTGSAVLLPIDENDHSKPEILICGGAPPGSFQRVRNKVFLHASTTCGRLKTNVQNPIWEMENMPMPRVMSDMLILPSGDIIMINGAKSGTAGWENARNPVTTPLIYRLYQEGNARFAVMRGSSRPRLYHSSAILVTDGRVLVGGSNPHVHYNSTGVLFPTDLSLEAFSPPYLAARHDHLRPKIRQIAEIINYRKAFSVIFRVQNFLKNNHVSVRIIAPSCSTHSFAMNQRMVVLKWNGISGIKSNTYRVKTIGPSSKEVAPPGYYMLFVIHAGIPSSGVWIKIQ